jgi:hypothetical protein
MPDCDISQHKRKLKEDWFKLSGAVDEQESWIPCPVHVLAIGRRSTHSCRCGRLGIFVGGISYAQQAWWWRLKKIIPFHL